MTKFICFLLDCYVHARIRKSMSSYKVGVAIQTLNHIQHDIASLSAFLKRRHE